MLSEQLGFDTDYIENRIKTLFLDGRVVGDINSTIINDGATLALSAALPGLAGATFRRSEDKKPDQSKINKKKIKGSGERGIITIKFFNLVLREVASKIIKSGFLVSKKDLSVFLAGKDTKFINACKSFKIDSKSVTMEAILNTTSSDESELVMLHVIQI